MASKILRLRPLTQFYSIGQKTICSRVKSVQLANLNKFQNQIARQISSTSSRKYESRAAIKDHDDDFDLKPEIEQLYRHAVKSVHPKQMIENVLEYNPETSVLKVQKEVYNLNRNVYVVGMGKAVMGMARAVEEVLGHHVVTGIISVPRGMQENMAATQNEEMMLSPNSRISIFEGAEGNRADHRAHNASKAIMNLVDKLKEKDLLIVLVSGGGSILCPSPPENITLEELNKMTKTLAYSGAAMPDVNTIRKNIEILKGGGIVKHAKPAKVVSLILSSIIGDPIDLIAGGPTYPAEPTPSHCMEILQRLNVVNDIPFNIKKHLETLVRQQALVKHDNEVWKGLQNIVVGNNSIACNAAAEKARELGYRPVIITTSLEGEAREVGKLYARLAEFIMMCFDRKLSQDLDSETSKLELDLVAGGIKKTTLNLISDEVDTAHNLNSDIAIISSGQTVVNVKGSGVGGKNMEVVMGAALQLRQDFRGEHINEVETKMCLLSADTDGFDGSSPSAGAMVDLDLIDDADRADIDVEAYLENNDSYGFFSSVNSGKNLVTTNHTGTNVMDMIILLIRKPIMKKYKWVKEE